MKTFRVAELMARLDGARARTYQQWIEEGEDRSFETDPFDPFSDVEVGVANR